QKKNILKNCLRHFKTPGPDEKTGESSFHRGFRTAYKEIRRDDSMSVADKYIHFVRQEAIEHPEKSWNKKIFGFQANKWRTRLLPKSGLSKGYQKLESMMMSLVADALAREDSYVWSNIFAPCEIMQSMGIRTLSIECLSCYLSGYHLEDQFIDYAQNAGIAPTLCSYQDRKSV